MKTKPLVLLLLAAAGVAGCSHKPRGAELAQRECAILESEMADAEAARRAAVDGQKNAWKAVLPVAAAARYTSHASAISAADRRLRELRAEFDRMSCEVRS